MDIIELLKILLNTSPLLAVIVFMFIVWIRHRKDSSINLNIKQKLNAIDLQIDECCDVVEKIWEAHDVKDQDGIYVWHLRSSMLAEQIENKKILQSLTFAIKDLHVVQQRQTSVLEKLIDKISGLN